MVAAVVVVAAVATGPTVVIGCVLVATVSAGLIGEACETPDSA